jgi:charged multivesicular body protein 1
MFDLRFNAKQLTKESQRCEKEEAAEKFKAKKCIEKGVIDAAKIHAENAIRKKSEAINYLRLASKMDSVASRIQSASRTEQMTKQFERAIPQLNNVMKRMNLERIGETMQQFEQVFENLDVATGYVSESLTTANATVTPPD